MKCVIKLLPLLERHLASKAIKQLNEQIITAVLNIGRRYNTQFHTCVAMPSFVYSYIDRSNVLHRSGYGHARLT